MKLYRSGSIVLVYNLQFEMTQDNNATMMHTTLTNIIESNRGVMMATVELGEVEKIRTAFGKHP